MQLRVLACNESLFVFMEFLARQRLFEAFLEDAPEPFLFLTDGNFGFSFAFLVSELMGQNWIALLADSDAWLLDRWFFLFG